MPTLRQTNIIIESEVEFKSNIEPPMTQSNEPSIEQMDIAIGRFMNMDGTDDFLRQNYQYHKRWELLMPVVEKIETIHSEFHGYFGVHISSNSCCIQGTKFDTRPGKEHYAYFNDVVHETKIRAAHYAVYQFITWYNQQNQNNDTTGTHKG